MNKKSLWLFTILFVGAVAIAEAQQAKKVSRIGFLSPGSVATFQSRIEAFRQGLSGLGYVEGRNIVVEYRFAEGKQDLMAVHAADLVRFNFDLIVTSSTSGVRAVKNASNAIPIVFTNVGDPVRAGLIHSLARPGGNITGLSTVLSDLGGKRLESTQGVFSQHQAGGYL
jgi:putative tryptophan/tyrosine transport system substrate-binding protein